MALREHLIDEHEIIWLIASHHTQRRLCADLERILKEIQHNHAVDAMHADDLSVELRRLSGASRAIPAGELAYMLHCFFDGCRRAMAYDKLALLNFGDERLTPAAKSAVMQSFRTG